MIAQKTPRIVFPPHTIPLNENTVICGALQVSGVTFLIICINKLLNETEKKASNILKNTFDLKDNT